MADVSTSMLSGRCARGPRLVYDGDMSDPAPPKPNLARFAKFVRAVAQVPKRELDAKLAAYERRRRPARERRRRTA
jgi:hypothetical protein